MVGLRGRVIQQARDVETQSLSSLNQAGFLIYQVGNLFHNVLERRFLPGRAANLARFRPPRTGCRFPCITSTKVLTVIEIQGRVCVCQRARARGSCITYGEQLFVYCLLVVVNVQLPPSSSPLAKIYFSFICRPDGFRFHLISQD